MRNISEIICMGPVIQAMPFQGIFYLELWLPLCSSCAILVDDICEIVLHSDQWFRRCHLKDFLSRALAALTLGGV